MLKPAVEGSGVAAGGAIVPSWNLAGVDDVTSKRLGSNTPVQRCSVQRWTAYKTAYPAEQVAALRGVSAVII
jgi:small subunit ribosomal protein S5